MVFVRVTPTIKKETPAETPTIDNPDGCDEIEYYDPTPEKTNKRWVKTESSKGKPRQYEETTGDPLPLTVEQLDDACFARIIREIKKGVSPYQACVNKRVPPDIFFRRCKERKDWADELKEAREVFAESKVAQLELLSGQLKRKTIDPSVYDKLSKTIIWMVERLFPTLYGNQSKVEFTTTHTIEIDQNKLREMNEMLRASQNIVDTEYHELKAIE